jgi:hypothetical protein
VTVRRRRPGVAARPATAAAPAAARTIAAVTGPSLAPGSIVTCSPIDLPTVTPIDLGSWSRRSYARPHLRLGTQPSEQPLLRLLDDVDLGVLFVDTQLVECRLDGFGHGPTTGHDPFHSVLLPLLLLA